MFSVKTATLLSLGISLGSTVQVSSSPKISKLSQISARTRNEDTAEKAPELEQITAENYPEYANVIDFAGT